MLVTRICRQKYLFLKFIISGIAEFMNIFVPKIALWTAGVSIWLNIKGYYNFKISLVIDDDDTHNDIHRKLKSILTIPVFDFTKLKYDNETSQWITLLWIVVPHACPTVPKSEFNSERPTNTKKCYCPSVDEYLLTNEKKRFLLSIFKQNIPAGLFSPFGIDRDNIPNGNNSTNNICYWDLSHITCK